MQFVLQMLMGIVVKFATQEFLEFILVLGAEALAKSTKTEYDDKIVEKVKAVLNKQ